MGEIYPIFGPRLNFLRCGFDHDLDSAPDPAGAAGARRSGDQVVERRAFLGTGTGGLVAAPLVVEAQSPGKQPSVAMLGGNPIDPTLFKAFKEGLGQSGARDARRW